MPARAPLGAAQQALAAAITTLVVVGVIALAVRTMDDEDLSHPAAWDPRVEELAAYVEEARGLRFDHPVHVDFLTAEEYTDVTAGEIEAADQEALDELQEGVAQLRALGMVSGDLDLAEVLGTATDAGTLAFYRPEDERIRVRGTEVTVGLRVTLVHELTHALQDQHFDLESLLGDGEDSSQEVARRALGEGDAMRVEEQYIDEELSDEERDAYDTEYQGEIDRSEEATQGVPPYISASFSTPYALGAPFVAMLYNDDGNDAVDEAFEDPPSTEEHLFDPASFLAGEDAEDTDVGLDDDIEITDEGPFGSPGWFLVLAERIDPNVAFDATLGWGGDAYAVFERDDAVCIRAVFQGDTERDEEEMGAAIDAWVAAMPGGKATRIDVDDHPGFDACDPGPLVDMQVTGRSVEVLILPNVWGFLIAESVAVLGADESRCFAAAVLEGLPYERLLGDEELTEEVARRAVNAYLECGSGDR